MQNTILKFWVIMYTLCLIYIYIILNNKFHDSVFKKEKYLISIVVIIIN